MADRIDWQRHDLATSFPTGAFDLVCAQFLHSPMVMPREQILRAAAAAVAPGEVRLTAPDGTPATRTDNILKIRRS